MNLAVVFMAGVVSGLAISFGILTFVTWVHSKLFQQEGNDMTLGTEVKKIGEDVLHVIEWPFKHAVEVGEFIADTIKDEPAVKEAIGELIVQAKPTFADIGDDIAEKGLNITDDLKTLQDLKAFAGYFKNTFMPVILQAYQDFKKVAEAPAVPSAPPVADPAPAEAASTEPQPGPGLHTVVPA